MHPLRISAENGSPPGSAAVRHGALSSVPSLLPPRVPRMCRDNVLWGVWRLLPPSDISDPGQCRSTLTTWLFPISFKNSLTSGFSNRPCSLSHEICYTWLLQALSSIGTWWWWWWWCLTPLCLSYNLHLLQLGWQKNRNLPAVWGTSLQPFGGTLKISKVLVFHGPSEKLRWSPPAEVKVLWKACVQGQEFPKSPGALAGTPGLGFAKFRCRVFRREWTSLLLFTVNQQTNPWCWATECIPKKV